MKIDSTKVIAALFLTLLMVAVAGVFEWYSRFNSSVSGRYYIVLAFALALIFVVSLLVISLLFRRYDRRQIRRISRALPKGDGYRTEPVNFVELSEKISGISKESESRIDMMKAMEVYRREYLGNISHELKTPLFSMQGYVETLREGGVEDLRIRDRYLDRISISLDRLLNVVQDLDMVNRLEAGEINLQLTDFDLIELIRETFELLELEADDAGAALRLEVIGSVWVRADRQKIGQVLVNLLANAIHYANRDRAVVSVEVTASEDQANIIIRDNGMGITPEHLPRIFERFYRVESSRSRRVGGSGLGLAIVKHILEAHRQPIEVRSVYLEGTQFAFNLDLAR